MRQVPPVTAPIPISTDAALVATLAGTAMAFAHDADDEADRWLRALRLHGRVGCALQALGVGEAPLVRTARKHRPELPRGPEAVAATLREAERRARARGGPSVCVCTPDLLGALTAVYGRPFRHALTRYGVTQDEIAAKLATDCAAPERPGR